MEKVKSGRCVIIAGQLEQIHPDIPNEITPSDFLICADKGYEYALSVGLLPDLIVGDFDSAKRPQTDISVIPLPVKKDETDLHFAAMEGVRRGYQTFVLSGVTGGRMDHTMASIFTLNALVSAGKTAAIHDRNTEIFLVTESLTLSCPDADCWFSVFPFDGAATGVTLQGAEYPLCDATLTGDFPIGVSNRFAEEKITVSLRRGKLLIMLVREK